MSAKETIDGAIESMKKTESTNPKAPAGSFFVNSKKLTIWEKDDWDKLEEGTEYSFLCTVQTNEYNGKTYTNYNVTSYMPKESLEKSDLKIGGLSVIVNDSIEEIHMSSKTIEYLKNILDY